MCHTCHHHHCCCPTYWCNTCVRYTHTVHYHPPQWYAWPPVRPVAPPPIICRPSTTVRDQRTIQALGGARV